jgi:hypothetical protein
VKAKLWLAAVGIAGAALMLSASASGRSAATSCTRDAASQVATAAGFDVDPGLGRTPINSVICGPFFGGGSQGMAATVAVPTGCGFSIGWGVFGLSGGAWKLVMKQDNGVLKLQPVALADGGADIRTTQGYPRRGDPRCSPSRMRSQVWHWNGSSFVASPWAVTEAKTVYFAHFRSPNGNIGCQFGGGQVPGIECVSVKPPRFVQLSPSGRRIICRTYGDPCLFSVKIFSDGSRIKAAPVLHYGQQALGSGLGSGVVCDSETRGITCKLRRSGKGFIVTATGNIKRVG